MSNNVPAEIKPAGTLRDFSTTHSEHDFLRHFLPYSPKRDTLATLSTGPTLRFIG